MSDASMDEPTQIDEARLRSAILEDLDGRILDAICAVLTPRFSVALAVLVILGITQGLIVNAWIVDLRTETTARGEKIDGAVRQLAALESDVVRRGQLEMLERQVTEMSRTARALDATVGVLRRQQEQLSTNIATVSALTLSVQGKVGEEQDARRELTQAIEGLGAQLRAQGVSLDAAAPK